MMSNSMISSVETSQESIRARWGIHATKMQQTATELVSWEQLVENMKKVNIGFHRSVASIKSKRSLLRKRMRNITLHKVISRLVPFKNQTSRSHRTTTKSVKSTTSSGSSDGSSDPDSISAPKGFCLHYIYILLLVSIPISAFLAHTSNSEVEK
ncbi:hypothetical protein [Yersinia intermedia]|uniref:hypothetical protein n=1 Tax=Yersinia intermedia TaxID=631 RepID=UPI00384AEAF9